MRWVASVAIVVLLAGCSGGGVQDTPTDADGFEDLGVEATATKGVLLGVVVDEAIRPLKGASVSVSMPGGANGSKTTDGDGRFAFGDLEPGTYFVSVAMLQYNSAQTTVEVVAGEDDPAVHRLQLTRLFSQDPYLEQIKFDGFIACAYAYGVSSTCVNDYTRLAGFVPGCQGGCLRDQNVSKTGGNVREFVTAIGPGWQSMVLEMVWEPSSAPPVSKGTMGMTVSFFERTSTGHWYGQADGPSPMRMQMDVGVAGPNQSEDPALIPPEGLNSLFVFFGAGNEDVALNQGFQFFQNNFYYAVPPEGWSFVEGDPIPF